MKDTNRREFLSKSIKGSAGISLSMAALPQTTRRVLGANEKVVLALIGAGNYGHKIATRIIKHPGVEFKYICEVDDSRGAGTIKAVGDTQGYAPKRILDMRDVFDDKDVEGVIIATPEQWHALATIRACQAGKDVYVEKAIALSLWESKKMLETARKYKRIVQCGTQNRSAPYAYTARRYIKEGGLGKVLYVKVYNMLKGSGPWNPPADSAVPAGLDWDRWLGPAQEVAYNKYRHKRWKFYWEYGTGELAHSGAHQLDLARLALGDPPHPKSVYAIGGRMSYGDKRPTPDLHTVVYDYGDFILTMEVTEFTRYRMKSGYDVRMGDKFPDWLNNGTRIEIYGTDRIMYLGRMGGGWQVFERQGRGKNKVVKVVAEEYGRYPSELHEGNFIDCIRSRKQPNGDIEQGHYSDTTAQMANVSYRVGKKLLYFDGKTERFTNCDEANKLLKPHYRKHYRVPERV